MYHIGYIRVSSVNQNTCRQLDGISLDKIFEEKVSAKTLERPELKNCLAFSREGDILHVHSMDRLARNLRDLETIVSKLNKKNVSIQFHKENLFFDGKGKTSPMNELLFNIIGAVAQFERAIIRERQLEGIELAKKRGAYKGRVRTIKREPILKDLAYGIKKVEVRKKYNISHSHLYRIIKEEKVEPKNVLNSL